MAHHGLVRMQAVRSCLGGGEWKDVGTAGADMCAPEIAGLCCVAVAAWRTKAVTDGMMTMLCGLPTAVYRAASLGLLQKWNCK